MNGHSDGERAPGDFERRTCLIANRLGLHARAAAKFVRVATGVVASVSRQRCLARRRKN